MSGLSRRSKESVFSILPAGIVMPFAGASAPEGWAFCDGTIISRNDYAELYVALGDSHGNGDGSTTFHLPDYRGRFLRGVDDGAGRDPGGRSSANAGGNSGDAIGSVQGEATAKNGLSGSTSGSTNTTGNHTHTARDQYGSSGSGTWEKGTVSGSTVSYLSSAGNHSHTVSASTTISSSDVETRGINANINYIIKL